MSEELKMGLRFLWHSEVIVPAADKIDSLPIIKEGTIIEISPNGHFRIEWENGNREWIHSDFMKISKIEILPEENEILPEEKLKEGSGSPTYGISNSESNNYSPF